MADLISNVSSGAAPLGSQSSEPAPANSAAAERFSSLMQDDLVAPPDAVVSSADPNRVGATPTLGEAMLQTLSAAGERYRVTKTDFYETAAGITNSPAGLGDLLRMQMRMADMSISIELISKGVAKVGQHVDQLTKLQ